MTRIVIIGGGPAGYEAALVAAQHGATSPSSSATAWAAPACSTTACRRRPSSPRPASGSTCTAPRSSASRRTGRPSPSTCRAVNARVKRLALAQSADIRAKRQGRASDRPGHGRASARPRPGTPTSSRPARPTATRGAARRRRADRHRRDPAGARRRPPGRRAHPDLAPGLRPDRAARAPDRRSAPASPAPSSLAPTSRSGVRVTLVSSRDRVMPHEDADAAAVLEDVFAERGHDDPRQGPRRRRCASDRRRGRGHARRRPDGHRLARADGGRLGARTRPTSGWTSTASRPTAAATSPSTGCRGPTCPASTRPATAPGVLPLASVAAMQGRIAMWHALGEAVAPLRLRTVVGRRLHRPGAGHRRRLPGRWTPARCRPAGHAAAGRQRPRQDGRPAPTASSSSSAARPPA